MSIRHLRRLDPQATREAILDAAREVLAQYGKEGLSIDQVAHRAGVNRSTAYMHFQTRDQLVEATIAWVSEKLHRAVFGKPALVGHESANTINIVVTIERLVDFAMENPTLGRIWLIGVLTSPRPAHDLFWKQYHSNLERFAQTERAQPGIDVEVLAVLILAGCFIWPVWARTRADTAEARRQMAQRFSRELLRLCLHGSLRCEKYPELVARLQRSLTSTSA
jgi:AcrR family transcriptional regulator